MIVIRPVQLTDLEALVSLASTAGYGLTTLPHDRELLRKRILKSQRSFRDMGDVPAGEAFLFVAEDVGTGRVIGTSGIVSKVGGFQPFYAYRLETSVHESQILGVHKEIPTLHLVAEHNGPSEIGSLFLAPEFRRDGNGRTLALARFLFMGQRPECFDPVVVAELRGVIDERGHSSFWDALGRHFFDVELPKADYLSMVDKRFIADLMPRHPIYTPLLPEAAQRLIGQVHEETRPAQRLLEAEGFRFANMVDIFDAGPVLTCRLREIRTVRESHEAKITAIPQKLATSQQFLIASAAPEFRAAVGPVDLSDGVAIAPACARALDISIGDAIRFAPLPSKEAGSTEGGGGPQ